MNFEYLAIFITIFISFLISFLLFLLITFLIYSKIELEKTSAYECGFHPFEDTRQKFNVRFYLVSILFIIFDLEVIFIFPWAICYSCLDVESIYLILIFLIVLTLGFIYEWLKGALTWE